MLMIRGVSVQVGVHEDVPLVVELRDGDPGVMFMAGSP